MIWFISMERSLLIIDTYQEIIKLITNMWWLRTEKRLLKDWVKRRATRVWGMGQASTRGKQGNAPAAVLTAANWHHNSQQTKESGAPCASHPAERCSLRTPRGRTSFAAPGGTIGQCMLTERDFAWTIRNSQLSFRSPQASRRIKTATQLLKFAGKRRMQC